MDKMEQFNKTNKLILIDPIDNKQYTVMVDDNDVVRAENDLAFAQSLLFHAKCTNTCGRLTVTPSVPNTTNTSAQHLLLDTNNLQVNTECNNNENCDPNNYKHIWKYNEIKLLINSFGVHYQDLQHPKKRKHVYELIANDLLSAEINVSAAACQNKWRSLMRSYTAAKDNYNKSGRGPSRFQFYDEIDEILGTKPTYTCTHTLDSASSTETGSTSGGDATPSEKRPRSRNGNASDSDGTPSQEKRKRKSGKDKRHEEKMELERKRLEIESRKCDLLERYLKSKDL